MSAYEVFSHLTAGTAAGVSQLLVGHPFDTTKVKMQSLPGKSNALAVATQTLKNEGVVGMYRGMATPLCFVALFNAVLFSSRGAVNMALRHKDGTELTLAEHTFSSMVASVPVSLVACPTELIKCRLQHQGTYASALERVKAWEAGGKKGPTPTLYRGPIDVLKQVYSKERGLRGLSNGLGATLIREIPGNGLMFGTYEGMKMAFAHWQGLASTTELGSVPLMAAGGCGGFAFWIVMYPSDVIKSKLQTQFYGHETYTSFLDCGRKVLAQDGWAGLYRGLMPCLLRSFPANAVAFVAYEAAMRVMHG